MHLSQRLIKGTTYLILLVGSIIMLAPFAWTISTSLKDQQYVFDLPPKWIPDPITFHNFKDVWAAAPIVHGFINSSTIIFFIMTIGLFISSMAAYAFAKIAFPFKDTIFLFLMSTMMIPYSVIMIPQFIGFSHLHWVDTLLPLIVPGLFGNIIAIYFLRQFMQSGIPNELIEAAKLDGCSFMRTFFTVGFPIAKPAIAAQAALEFMGIWNDFLGPLIYLHTPEKQTIQVLIAGLQSMYISSSNYPLIMAASLVAMVPVIIVFFFCQRYFVESLAISGLKG